MKTYTVKILDSNTLSECTKPMVTQDQDLAWGFYQFAKEKFGDIRVITYDITQEVGA